MKWDANFYQEKHGFVAEYGKSLLEYVNLGAGQKILDLGCGTGALTKELAAQGADVTGVDFSEAMIEKAKVLYPDLTFQVENAICLPYENVFDTVFSNAVFHLILDHRKLLQSIKRALKEKGFLVCEFGAAGNIQSIEKAFSMQMNKRGRSYHSPFFFPDEETYEGLLHETGLRILRLVTYDRPTSLQDGRAGLRNWMRQFFVGSLYELSAAETEEIFDAIEAELETGLWQDGKWVADYRRIQIIAQKP